MNYYNQIKEQLLNNEVYKKVKDYSKNKNELETYYNVGKLLIEAQGGEERAKYGDGLIKEYSKRLTNELGRGYSTKNLKYMRKFYILSKSTALPNLLTWSHYCEILPLKNKNEIDYYIKIAIEQNLPYRKLGEKIKNKEYERLSEETKEKLINNEENNLETYSEKEIENFKNGKVKIVKSQHDINSFVKESIKIKNNTKLYFGKIGKDVARKIQNKLDINVENYNVSLKSDAVNHILNHHSTERELLRGQRPITKSDFNLIPQIVTNYDTIKSSGLTKQGKPVITFEKQMGDNYYLINYVSDKKHNLEVQTMFKHKKKELFYCR